MSAQDDQVSSFTEVASCGRPLFSSTGVCRVFDRDALASIIAQAELDTDDGIPAKRFSLPQKEETSKHLKKRQDMMAKLAETRAKDQRYVKEQVDHQREMREQRFERLLGGVTGDDMYLKGYVTEMLRNQGLQYSKRIGNMFHEWNAKIYENLQKQLDSHLNPLDRSLMQSLSGQRSVDFMVPDEKPVVTCNPNDNPAYKQLLKHHNECELRQRIDYAVYPSSYPHMGSLAKAAELDHGNLNANLKYLDSLDANACGHNPDDINPTVNPRRWRSKPILEPDMWGQLALQGTQYGHFAQICAHGPGFKTNVKRGNHAPCERDNIPAAGKRKTRLTRNDLGMLRGEIANRGESIQYKTAFGAGCGAPGQDHFTYPGGTQIVDSEFPLGKLMYPHKH